MCIRDRAGGLTATGTVTANGGVRVPLPATAQEAISYEALIAVSYTHLYQLMPAMRIHVVPGKVSKVERASVSYESVTKEGIPLSLIHI